MFTNAATAYFPLWIRKSSGGHLRVNKHNPKYYPKMEEKPEKPVYAISEEPEYKVLSYVPEESVEEPKVIRRGIKKYPF